MAETFSNNRGSGVYGFPSHDVSPEIKKGKDWCLQFCRAIDSLYRNNLTGITLGDVDTFRMWRLYGQGNQPPQKYMDLLGIQKKQTPNGGPGTVADGPNQGGDTFGRKGYMNISFENLSVVQNFKNIVLGTFEEIEHDVFADGLDEASSAERQQMQSLLWVEREMREFFDQIQKDANIKIPTPDYIPETQKELQMFAELGGFKLRSEISIERAISYTLDISEWKEIKRKIIMDLFDLGVAGAKDYLDPFTQKVKTRYCDPELCVIPWDRQGEFSNMPFAGEYIFYTIAEIRALTDTNGKRIFTEDELQNIARMVQGQFMNPTMVNFSLTADLYGRYEYDQLKVCVLDSEFKSDDTVYNTERTTKDGKKVVHKDEYGKVRDSEKRKTHVTKALMVYRCKWIVGTEYAWDYGHQFDIVRPTPSEAVLSFHFYKMKTGSYIKRMIPLLDSIQLAWLKLQNAKAEAKNKGVAIEISSITNVSFGNNKLAPLDIFRIYGQKGDLLFQATPLKSYSPSQTNYKPIQELQGGMGPILSELLMSIGSDIEQLRGIIGISRIADASSPNSEDLVGVSEISMQATTTSLRPMYSAYITIKERTCRNIALRVQMIIRFSKLYELGYVRAFGKSITETLKIGSEVENAMFGIRIEARPNQQEKQQIMAAAEESLRVGRQGQPLLNYSDYLMIQNFVNLGMTKMARAYIAQKERETIAKIEEEKKLNMEQQNQATQQQIQAKAEADAQLVQLDMQKISLQGEEDRKTLEMEYNYKMQIKQMELEAKADENLMNQIVEQNKPKENLNK